MALFVQIQAREWIANEPDRSVEVKKLGRPGYGSGTSGAELRLHH